ncbi:solute carrier family 35 member F1 [Reticulomyxa filosa]|uniref:Solute carrier family 35 member F1 n=1 Tax=Reticulomyxa filosa TaxID=46433 RepID=X6M575_RETFI|nr:solute carrier family 35 member F1 [Reticulomyxa filosa]|eukprot:ETO08185.1 solute carrier family 35 member F1 [Reticulomyxa filosa]
MQAQMNWIAWGYYIGYVGATICFYTLAPVFLTYSNATLMNLSLLTSDLYAMCAGMFLFRIELHPLYFVSFVMVISGVIMYNVFERQIQEQEDAYERQKQHRNAQLGDIALSVLPVQSQSPSSDLRHQHRPDKDSIAQIFQHDEHNEDDEEIISLIPHTHNATTQQQSSNDNELYSKQQTTFHDHFQSRTQTIKLKPPQQIPLNQLAAGNLTDKFRHAFNTEVGQENPISFANDNGFTTPTEGFNPFAQTLQNGTWNRYDDEYKKKVEPWEVSTR